MQHIIEWTQIANLLLLLRSSLSPGLVSIRVGAYTTSMTCPWSWRFPYSKVWAAFSVWCVVWCVAGCGNLKSRFRWSLTWRWSKPSPYSEVWAAFVIWCVVEFRKLRSLFRWILAWRWSKPWHLVWRARRRHQSSSRNLSLQ